MEHDDGGDLLASYDCECCPSCCESPCSGSMGSEFWCDRQRCTCNDDPLDDAWDGEEYGNPVD